MNFNIIHRKAIILDEIYDDVKDDYCNSNLTNDEIRKKYDLSYCDLRDISRQIKKELNIHRRPTLGAKNYYEVSYGFCIQKKINGETIHFGTVPTENVAKKMVEHCRKELWDIDKCKEMVHNWRDYMV